MVLVSALFLALSYDPYGEAEPQSFVQLKPRTIPILAYHRFSADIHSRLHHLDTTPQSFQEQLDYLKQQGYQTVSLDVFLQENKGKPLPEKPVIITIDDGFKSTYTVAFPMLKKMGFSATAFICPQYIGSAPALMTWSQCQEMAAAGFSIQSHSYIHGHLSLPRRGEDAFGYLDRVSRELQRSKSKIEDKIRMPVRHLAYPYGDYDLAVESLAVKSGYRTICLATRGTNTPWTNPVRLERNFINSKVTFNKFKGFLDVLYLSAMPIAPQEASVIKRVPLVLKARLLRMDRLDLSTVQMYLGERSYPTVVDEKTGQVSCAIPFLPRFGFHTASIVAREKLSQKTSMYSWTFAVRRKSDVSMFNKLLKLMNTSEVIPSAAP